MERNEVLELLQTGRTKLIQGFVSTKTGKAFSAPLHITPDFKVEYDFSDKVPVDAAGNPIAKKLNRTCPVCGKAMLVLGRSYACEAGDFSIPIELSGRTMSPEEADYLLTHRITPKCGGFFSAKKNKAFIAGYKLDENNKVELFF
jgi:hypothetical protein